MATKTCIECNRVFDLTNPDDAEEWTFGHDCEPTAIECPNHAGSFDCSEFCNICQGNQEFTPISFVAN